MKKITAAVTAALLALGGVALTAAPASAHTGGVTGVAACEPDGTYSVTWTYNATNVPEGVEAETKAMTTTPGSLAPIDGVAVGSQVMLSSWTEHLANWPSVPVKTGNWSATFKTVGVPGAHVGEITTMVQTDWKNGPSEDPVGRVVVDGSCSTPEVPEEPEVVYPPVIVPAALSGTPATCDADGTFTLPDGTPAQNHNPAAGLYGVEMDGYHLYVRNTTGEFGGPGAYTWEAYGIGANGNAAYPNGTSVGGKTDSQGNPKAGGKATGSFTVDAKTGDCPVPPPTLQQCVEIADGGVSTNLVANGWDFSETRATGHNDYVDGGLHVYTEGATSTDKAAGYRAASFPLADAGLGFSINATDASGGFPGLQMAVDLDNDGDLEGYLVHEPVYGTDTLWLSANWGGADLTGAPTSINGGGTGKGGHANDWLAAYPDAQVHAIGYSLGSGVKGDLVITSIVVGCTSYTFDHVEPAAEPEPAVETREESVTDCEAGTLTTTTYTRETGEATFDPATNTWTRGEFGEWTAGEPVVRDATAEECPVTPPTEEPTPEEPTPSEEPTPAPSATPVPLAQGDGDGDVLAVTGADGSATVGWLTGGALAIALGALGVVLGLRRRAVHAE